MPLIPPQVKYTLIAVGIASVLSMGWGIKTLYAKTVLQGKELKDQAALIRGWDQAYQALMTESRRVDRIVTEVEVEKDEAQRTATALAIALEKEKARDKTKCAITTVPATYMDTLIDGLPSRRKATTGVSTTGGVGATDQPDPVP